MGYNSSCTANTHCRRHIGHAARSVCAIKFTEYTDVYKELANLL